MMASAVSDMTVQDDGSGRRFCSLDDVANLGSSTTLQGSQNEKRLHSALLNSNVSFGLKYSPSSFLQVHFFGRDDKHHLNFDEFSAFVNAIQREVLRAEFLEYSRGLDKVDINSMSVIVNLTQSVPQRFQSKISLAFCFATRI